MIHETDTIASRSWKDSIYKIRGKLPKSSKLGFLSHFCPPKSLIFFISEEMEPFYSQIPPKTREIGAKILRNPSLYEGFGRILVKKYKCPHFALIQGGISEDYTLKSFTISQNTRDFGGPYSKIPP